MTFPKRLAPLVLCAALFFPPRANADINLFPPNPIEDILMTDSDEYKTKIIFPENLDEDILQKPLKEVWQEYSPYISISKTLPLFSLDWRIKNSEDFKIFVQHAPTDGIKREIKRIHEGKDITDKILSLSFIGSGLLDFPEIKGNDSEESNGNFMQYKGKLEAFLTSPMINEYFSDGNRLYFTGGLETRGLIDSNKVESISSLANFPPTDYRFFGDVYIVAKSPWSEQFVIIRTGLDNLLNNDKKDFHFSTTFEFPSIFYQKRGFENFKLSPYLSLYARLPLTSGQVNTAAGEVGLKLSGETDKAIVLYAKGELNNGFCTFSSGLKLNL